MCPTRPVGGIFVNWNDVDNTCPLFSLVGQEHNAKVVDVYDGDSIKIVIKLYSIVFGQKKGFLKV